MRQARDYSNQKVGKLLVIKRAPDVVNCYGSPVVMWQCECECGEAVVRRGYHLSRGNCMCKKCKAVEDARRHGHQEIRQHHWYQVQKQASKRGLEFAITLDYAWSIYESQQRRCVLSGLPIGFALTKKAHAKGDTTASLDRIDSSAGYIEGNVQWLHKWVNIMKSDFTQSEFINYCKLVVEYGGKT